MGHMENVRIVDECFEVHKTWVEGAKVLTWGTWGLNRRDVVIDSQLITEACESYRKLLINHKADILFLVERKPLATLFLAQTGNGLDTDYFLAGVDNFSLPKVNFYCGNRVVCEKFVRVHRITEREVVMHIWDHPRPNSTDVCVMNDMNLHLRVGGFLQAAFGNVVKTLRTIPQKKIWLTFEKLPELKCLVSVTTSSDSSCKLVIKKCARFPRLVGGDVVCSRLQLLKYFSHLDITSPLDFTFHVWDRKVPGSISISTTADFFMTKIDEDYRHTYAYVNTILRGLKGVGGGQNTYWITCMATG